VKNWEWIKKESHCEIEIGLRDLRQGTAVLSRRDKPPPREILPSNRQLAGHLPEVLDTCKRMLARATAFRDNITRVTEQGGILRIFHPAHSTTPKFMGFALAIERQRPA